MLIDIFKDKKISLKCSPLPDQALLDYKLILTTSLSLNIMGASWAEQSRFYTRSACQHPNMEHNVFLSGGGGVPDVPRRVDVSKSNVYEGL